MRNLKQVIMYITGSRLLDLIRIRSVSKQSVAGVPDKRLARIKMR
jgi:hypothetical protein